MDTKTKILEQAIELFNERGVSNVSIRNIAEGVGISPGNFSYHFKNKQVLIRYFYEHVYQEPNPRIAKILQNEKGLFLLQKLLEVTADFSNRYKFFFTDIVEIFRMCPDIKEKFMSNYEVQKAMYKDVLVHFVQAGWIKKPLQSQGLDAMAHLIWFNMVFWQSQAHILPSSNGHQKADHVILDIWQMIKPLMTEKGHSAWDKMHALNTVAKSLSQWI